MNRTPEELCNDKHVIVVLCVDDHLGLAEGGDVRVRSVLDGRICNNSKFNTVKLTRDRRDNYNYLMYNKGHRTDRHLNHILRIHFQCIRIRIHIQV
jgi:hypothetical protein